jgi:hypothetical protein
LTNSGACHDIYLRRQPLRVCFAASAFAGRASVPSLVWRRQFIGSGRAVIGPDRYRFIPARQSAVVKLRRHAAIVRSKIDDLITNEVSSGKLTSDQAAELQTVFSNTFASGGPGGPDAAGAPGGVSGGYKTGGHHHGGHGGAEASSSADSSSSTDKASDLLQQFLRSLKDSQSPSTSYDASGDSSTGTISALLVDYQS